MEESELLRGEQGGGTKVFRFIRGLGWCYTFGRGEITENRIQIE